ncbi:GNAT family N-acetyltransferase [Cohnella lubricantis]|uniref:GNAT family N-acetyltransferase n=1 Tax=Cohnella lubricantis TaxID=2163172 RepID=A0A841T7F7_9BACL|nr:GNAT family N-acetyltransferase [Cohnella lubricantis]MBB6675885.1 GNAT family N-acetyltransferase [Cohnella lubricantis]MBP2117198.1 putative acetyltransferase [Cohnella lubricantis]
MTSQPSITVANAPSPQQLEDIFNILGEVFPVGKAFFQDRLLNDSSYDPQTTWFATVEGKVASTIQIFPLHIRVGQAVLKIGGIGSVGTDPCYRGIGLAQSLLRAQTEWMKQNDYDASLLLAIIHAFYEKAGWKLIPEKGCSMPKPDPIEPPAGYEIVPFEAQYLDQLRHIYEQYNDGRTYTLIRDEAYWNDLLLWPAWTQADCLLVRHNGRIVAYGLIEKSDQAKVFIQELVYLPEAASAVVALFTALGQLRPHAKHVLAKLPDDHPLAEYYKQQPQAEQLDLNISMWKMIHCRSMLQKLRPELEHRIRSSEYAEQKLHLELRAGEDRFWLNYADRKLAVSQQADPFAAYESLQLDPWQLISSVIFGYEEASGGIDRPRQADSAASAILRTLFPKQQAVFYLTDKF